MGESWPPVQRSSWVDCMSTFSTAEKKHKEERRITSIRTVLCIEQLSVHNLL